MNKCYSCGKSDVLMAMVRITESPKDTVGIRVPICRNCIPKDQADDYLDYIDQEVNQLNANK